MDSESLDGSLADPSPEETALDRAIEVARASKYLRERFYRTRDQFGNPIVYERDLPDVLANAEWLRHALGWLQQSLTDGVMRKRLADSHTEAVSYAGEVAPSYVEAIFRAGERQYATVGMLCQYGVMFDYLSRLHPSQSEKLSEPWPQLPKLEEIKFTGSIKGDGSGHNCTSAEQLLAKICREVTALPDVDSTVDCEQVRTFLEKEIAATKGQGGDAGDDPPDCDHSPDFRSVNWFGNQYSFTGNQAAAIRLLWEAWQSGTPDVGGETLLQAADASTQRIDVVFRDNPAWRAMIVGYQLSGGPKGTYRLAKPAADPPKRQKRRVKKTSPRARK